MKLKNLQQTQQPLLQSQLMTTILLKEKELKTKQFSHQAQAQKI